MQTLHKRRTSPNRTVAISSAPPSALDFTPGSLEAELAAIGRSVPASAWAKVPKDLFANIDHYLYGAPKRK